MGCIMRDGFGGWDSFKIIRALKPFPPKKIQEWVGKGWDGGRRCFALSTTPLPRTDHPPIPPSGYFPPRRFAGGRGICAGYLLPQRSVSRVCAYTHMVAKRLRGSRRNGLHPTTKRPLQPTPSKLSGSALVTAMPHAKRTSINPQPPVEP
jgi:hypothetical protein